MSKTGDPGEARTRDTAVKGLWLNHLPTGPDICNLFLARQLPNLHTKAVTPQINSKSFCTITPKGTLEKLLPHIHFTFPSALVQQYALPAKDFPLFLSFLSPLLRTRPYFWTGGESNPLRTSKTFKSVLHLPSLMCLGPPQLFSLTFKIQGSYPSEKLSPFLLSAGVEPTLISTSENIFFITFLTCINIITKIF